MLHAIDILKYYGLYDTVMRGDAMDGNEENIQHFGVGYFDNPPGRGSGRFAYGSGSNPFQHVGNFLRRVAEYEAQGLTQSQIAKQMQCTVTSLRAQISLAKHLARNESVDKAEKLRAKGYSLRAIAAEMNIPEATVRSLLDEKRKARMNAAMGVAEALKKEVDEKGIIDIGKGTEHFLGTTSGKLDEAVEILRLYGYEVYGGSQEQMLNPQKRTIIKAIAVPGTPEKDIYDPEKVHNVGNIISYDGGETFEPGFAYPESMDSSRLKIIYPAEGGKEKDGLVELRPGCKDLDLGDSTYAQVRILVDGTHYIKGMAVYGDEKDFPPGVDVLFNVSKPDGTPLKDAPKGQETVLKKIKSDPSNPFGSLIKDQEHGGQYYWYDENGEKHLGLINKRADAGDWEEWAKTLPAQFLSKQPLKLINSQLQLAELERKQEFDDILALTNETVKKKLLLDFAEECDTAAATLKAAALPGQRYQVILPLDVKDGEVYAPNYEDGTIVALVRYPHGGTFEIPILKVNNKNPEGERMIGKSGNIDAIGINAETAAKLSGADFDGDTVQVIPCNSSNSSVHIQSREGLEGLTGFDPHLEYPYREGRKLMTKSNTQKQMGEVTNLITDMQIFGANDDEVAAAVRHSMVIIDAEKHKLDYTKSAEDNNIADLKDKYQGHYTEDGRYSTGANTLISRANASVRVSQTQGQPSIDPKTGELVWKLSDKRFYEEKKTVPVKDPNNPRRNLKDEKGNTVVETYIDQNGKEKPVKVPTGKIVERTKEVTAMSTVKDAYDLMSPKRTEKEKAYGDYANYMKSLANQARLEYLAAKQRTPRVSKEAKETYKTEVEDLQRKLVLAESNSPKERQAQRLAKIGTKYRVDALDEEPTKKERQKIETQELAKARATVGAKRYKFEITDREWEAIQAHAIADSTLSKMLEYADPDRVRQLSTPRATTTITPTQQNRIKAMSANGYSNAEIAKAVGVSTSTVLNYLKQK